MVLLLIPLQLHPVELDLGLGAVSSLAKPLHVEFFWFSEIVFWGVLYFIVEKPRFIISVIVTTV